MATEKRHDQVSLLSHGRFRQLRSRHVRARIFAWACALAIWVGVAMLVTLLLDVLLDSTGWIYGRIDRDPRMFALLAESSPEFLASAKEQDPELFRAIEGKLSSRQRKLERDGSALTDNEIAELEMGVLHAKYTKDETYFTQFDMNPSSGQRFTVLSGMLHDLLTNFASRHPTKAGLKSALIGSIWLLVFTALLAIPIGIAAAIYLEEYAPRNRLNRFIEVNIANLAGVPSIVYGILGLAIFVRWLALGRSVLAGAATMSLLILPVIIISAREAIKAVPTSIRQGAYALGTTRWQVVRHHVLPAALPGILTGVILAMSRAIGETAPMIMIGALSYVAFVPQGPLDDFTVMPIQIFNWISMPQHEFHMLGACGILILLALLLAMNSIAIYIRYRAQRNIKW